MLKIKLLFFFSILFNSCSSDKLQYSAELKESSIILIEKLISCYQTLEYVQPLNNDKFFIQFNTEKNENGNYVFIYLIEKDLIFGKTKPNIISKYKNFDIYAFGTNLETFFKIEKPTKLVLNFAKTKKNELVTYDPIYLKAYYSVDENKNIEIKYSPCEVFEPALK